MNSLTLCQRCKILKFTPSSETLHTSPLRKNTEHCNFIEIHSLKCRKMFSVFNTINLMPNTTLARESVNPLYIKDNMYFWKNQ